MKTPRSFGALLRACWYCTCPNLDSTDRSLLAFIAAYGDSNGGNSHPGNANIAAALGLSNSPARQRIKNNLDRRLIECTHGGDGRGHASVYRIRWESDFFPDRAPGGKQELLSVDCAAEEHACLSKHVSETCLPESQMVPATPPKHACAAQETCPPEQAHNLKEQPKEQPPTNNLLVGGRGFLELTPEEQEWELFMRFVADKWAECETANSLVAR